VVVATAGVEGWLKAGVKRDCLRDREPRSAGDGGRSLPVADSRIRQGLDSVCAALSDWFTLFFRHDERCPIASNFSEVTSRR